MAKPTDESLGVDVAWSWTGFSAKVRSRLLSALDRAGARKIDQSGLEDERRQAIHRALTDAQLTLITASANVLEERIRNEPELAQQALAVFSRAERQAENLEASLALAIEDLKGSAADEPEKADAPDVLDPEFLNRWEHYAAGATSEVVREKWGRILSSEIRSPGTFSLKTLRIIDELDHESAVLFQRFCQNRLGGWVPELLLNLSASELSQLQQAGLVFETDFPRTVGFWETESGLGDKGWLLKSSHLGLVVLQNSPPPTITSGAFDLGPLRMREGKLVMNVIVLTKVGEAIAAIIPRDEEAALRRLATAISGGAQGSVILLRQNPEGGLSPVDEDVSPEPTEGDFSRE